MKYFNRPRQLFFFIFLLFSISLSPFSFSPVTFAEVDPYRAIESHKENGDNHCLFPQEDQSEDGGEEEFGAENTGEGVGVAQGHQEEGEQDGVPFNPGLCENDGPGTIEKGPRMEERMADDSSGTEKDQYDSSYENFDGPYTENFNEQDEDFDEEPKYETMENDDVDFPSRSPSYVPYDEELGDSMTVDPFDLEEEGPYPNVRSYDDHLDDSDFTDGKDDEYKDNWDYDADQDAHAYPLADSDEG